MSLLSKAKSAASKVAEGAKKGIKALKTTQQITSTLNEFSTVEKAVLAFPHCKYSPIKVQINPSDLTYEYQSQQDMSGLLTSSLDGKPQELAVTETNPNIRGSLSFMLYYDFYDEYYARSANGSGFSLNSLTSSFHLKNEKFSSLETIIEQSKIHAPVFFKWGEIEEFGYMHTASPRYGAFSPWGEPLKATINIVISILNYNSEKSKSNTNLNEETQKIFDELKKKSSGGTAAAIGGAIKKLGSTIKALR